MYALLCMSRRTSGAQHSAWMLEERSIEMRIMQGLLPVVGSPGFKKPGNLVPSGPSRRAFVERMDRKNPRVAPVDLTCLTHATRSGLHCCWHRVWHLFWLIIAAGLSKSSQRDWTLDCSTRYRGLNDRQAAPSGLRGGG